MYIYVWWGCVETEKRQRETERWGGRADENEIKI